MSDPWQPWLTLVVLLWVCAMLQGLPSLWDTIKFLRFMRSAAAAPPDRSYQPSAAVIMPCCGVDDELRQTVAALGSQDYPDYRVVFTFESADDPAYAAVRGWASEWPGVRWTQVIAGPADGRSQKVQNLLAAVQSLDAAIEVIAFIDSDAIPHPTWLAELTAPLRDPTIGASTGFRWYRAAGGWVEGLRSAWNAASVSFLHNPRYAFCWGGSTAIRAVTFQSCNVAGHWRTALSDDFQLTRAVQAAGLHVRFVPRCLVSCEERMPFRQFIAFARRQLIITRICSPGLWRAAVMLATMLISAASATFVLMLLSAYHGRWTLAAVSCAAWLAVLTIARAKAVLRQAGIALFLRPPRWTWRDWAHDVLGAEWVGCVHLFLLLSTTWTRRVTWRNRVYELVSADETRVITPP